MTRTPQIPALKGMGPLGVPSQRPTLDGDLHFDYAVQAWIRDGRFVRCEHPDSMKCQCYGRIHEGETEAEARFNAGRATPLCPAETGIY